MILVGDRSLHAIVKAPAMKSIARRITHDFHLRPMTHDETAHYLHSKLKAAGSLIPEFVFPAAVCTELWRASGGWPGILDRIALLALARSETLPVRKEQIESPVLPKGTWDEIALEEAEAGQETSDAAPPPVLQVSSDGVLLKELSFDLPRFLIGRSDHNDLAIASRFISRHHVLLVRHGSSTLLMDLNSASGTFVNSNRVSNHVLVNGDLITIGHHNIKFSDPQATTRGTLEGTAFADTAILKTLQDMRKLLAQENTELVAVVKDVSTTSGQ
jgi:pSer/pThr/pTyr-binding forkhead associated (FHA) protein